MNVRLATVTLVLTLGTAGCTGQSSSAPSEASAGLRSYSSPNALLAALEAASIPCLDVESLGEGSLTVLECRSEESVTSPDYIVTLLGEAVPTDYGCVPTVETEFVVGDGWVAQAPTPTEPMPVLASAGAVAGALGGKVFEVPRDCSPEWVSAAAAAVAARQEFLDMVSAQEGVQFAESTGIEYGVQACEAASTDSSGQGFFDWIAQTPFAYTNSPGTVAAMRLVIEAAFTKLCPDLEDLYTATLRGPIDQHFDGYNPGWPGVSSAG